MDELKLLIVGAGTMGVEIALAFAMAGQDVCLLDLPGSEGGMDVSAAAIERALLKYPQNSHENAALDRIRTGNIREDLAMVGDRDWLIEAVPEDLSLKVNALQKLAPYIAPSAMITSNTSGISIRSIRSRLPGCIQARFFGTHFFNPASKNRLVELIPADIVDQLSFNGIRTNLLRMGKVCVESEDVSNFIVNRFAFYFVMEAIEDAIRLKLTVPEVDGLSGKVIGRPRSATFGLLDLIGLDVWLSLCKNMGTEIDAFPRAMKLVEGMVELGILGRKTDMGFYTYSERRPNGNQKLWLDIPTMTYRDSMFVLDVSLEGELTDRIKKLAVSTGTDRAAQFQSGLIESMIEAGQVVLDSAPGGRSDVDTAIRIGLAHEMGPFEMADLLNGVVRTGSK